MRPYGSGEYGGGRYGMGSALATPIEATLWFLELFGDSTLLALSTSDGRLLAWAGDVTADAVPVATAPDGVAFVITPEAFVLMLGADDNPRRVAWPSQATFDDWTPTADNTAGGFSLSTQGRLLSGCKLSRETALFTDDDFWIATWTGDEFVYGFTQRGKQCGLVAPNAFASFGNDVIWMGREAFYIYQGEVRQLPCDVHDRVFNDLNRAQIRKTWTKTVAEFGEVWFHYPSATSLECDRYVCYNYWEKHWSFGTLRRSAGCDAGVLERAVMVSPEGFVYEHEVGKARDGVRPFIEGGPLKLGDGDQVFDVLGVVADEQTLGDAEATLFARYEPMGDETEEGPFVAADANEQGLIDARFSARVVRLRLTQNESGSKDWRVGIPALMVTPAGFR
jgi:hypothetical protein